MFARIGSSEGTHHGYAHHVEMAPLQYVHELFGKDNEECTEVGQSDLDLRL